MKRLWLLLKKTHNLPLSRHIIIPINIMYTVAIIAVLLLLIVIKACVPEQTTSVNTDKKAALKQRKVAEIEDSINNSYARLASQHVDICPKLLQSEVDRKTIKRTEEVMVDDYCDYFLYPHKGQQISTVVNNDQIEVLLIVPVLHDFANGNYVVTSYDKHVIRLSYNGASYKPERLSYDVAISVSN